MLKIVLIGMGYVLGFLILSVYSCQPNHRYLYEKFEVSVIDEGGTHSNCDVLLKIRGTEFDDGFDAGSKMRLSSFKSPYSILIKYRFPKTDTGVVTLQELSFVQNGAEVRSFQPNIEEEFDNITEYRRGGIPKVREEDESRAIFLLEDVDLPHEEMVVKIKSQISRQNSKTVSNCTFKISPFTEEDLRNDQLDAFSSV